MSIGENIRYLRKRAKLTQKKLADMTGVNEVTIRSYESGKYEPKTETIYKLVRALGCNINEILEIPFDLLPRTTIEINNIDELAPKFKELTGKDLLQGNIKSDDYFEMFLCYLESLGYKLSILDIEEMKMWNIIPEYEDDFYIGIQDNEHDNVTFFHKSDFLNLQKEVERTISYEIYKQFMKHNNNTGK